MIFRYPPEVHEFVKAHVKKLRDEDLAKACNEALGTNFTANRMKAFRGNHGYTNGKKQWNSEEYWMYQKRYPKGMYEFVRDNSWGVSSKDMAEMVNEKFGTKFTPSGMKQFRQRNRIKSGVTGWFQTGRPPANKGKKLEEYLEPEKAKAVRKRIKKTQFKKGNKPLNEMPLGTISKTTEGYLIRKISMTGTQWERWEMLHHRIWEDNYGPIPEGSVIIFKDQNKENCTLENLLMVKRSEMSVMAKHKFFFKDPEMTEAGLAVVKLKLEANKRRRDGKTV